MAKMTLSALNTFVGTYVNKAKQAGSWSATTDNFVGLLDKVGKQVTIDGEFNDKLAEMNGDALPYGKTIEEYFIDLTLPSDFDATGATNLAPANPTCEDVAYSYTLGRKKIKTTTPYDNFERACLSGNEAGNIATKIMERLYDSQSLYTYAIKRQLLANVIDKAESASNASTLVEVLTAPTNETTSKAFIKSVKEAVEVAKDVNEGHNLGNYLIGASPRLTLYVKQGVIPTIAVETLAGAFNSKELTFGVDVKVIKDFGNNNSGVYAMLIDPRGVKLHEGYRALRTAPNADGDFMNHTLHSEYTGFISKSTFVKVYKGA